MRWLFGLFLVAHGLIHVAIWLTPASSDAPFDVRHSPLFGDLGVASGVSLVLLLATFTTWWLLALVIDVALAVVALRSLGGSR